MTLQKELAKIEAILRAIELHLLQMGAGETWRKKVEQTMLLCTAGKISFLQKELPVLIARMKAAPALPPLLGKNIINLELAFHRLNSQLNSYSLDSALSGVRGQIRRKMEILEGRLERLKLMNDTFLTAKVQEFMAPLEKAGAILAQKTIPPSDENELIDYFYKLSEKMRGINIYMQQYRSQNKIQWESCVGCWNEIISMISGALLKAQQRVQPQAVVLRGNWGGVEGIEMRRGN